MPETKPGELMPASPFGGNHVVDAVTGIAASKSRSLGSDAASAIVAASMSQMSRELESERKSNSDLRDKIEMMTSQMGEERSKVAVLEERVRSEQRTKNLRNLCILIGTSMVVFAIELYANELLKYAAPTSGFGVLLLAYGWFSSGRAKTK